MSARRAIFVVVGVLAVVAIGCTPTGGGGGTTTTGHTTTTIDPGLPVALASASPTIGNAPYTVSFDSAGSTTGTGTGLIYSWNFGDGSTPDTTSGATASHVYTTVGHLHGHAHDGELGWLVDLAGDHRHGEPRSQPQVLRHDYR